MQDQEAELHVFARVDGLSVVTCQEIGTKLRKMPPRKLKRLLQGLMRGVYRYLEDHKGGFPTCGGRGIMLLPGGLLVFIERGNEYTHTFSWSVDGQLTYIGEVPEHGGINENGQLTSDPELPLH